MNYVNLCFRVISIINLLLGHGDNAAYNNMGNVSYPKRRARRSHPKSLKTKKTATKLQLTCKGSELQEDNVDIYQKYKRYALLS